MFRNNESMRLVVDDDATLARLMAARLEWEGLRTIIAESGHAALQIFATERIDVVLTDLEMPNGDGIWLTREIRKIADTPVILLTGHREDHRREIRNLHDVTVIRKPVASIDVALAVEADLERRRAC